MSRSVTTASSPRLVERIRPERSREAMPWVLMGCMTCSGSNVVTVRVVRSIVYCFNLGSFRRTPNQTSHQLEIVCGRKVVCCPGFVRTLEYTGLGYSH